MAIGLTVTVATLLLGLQALAADETRPAESSQSKPPVLAADKATPEKVAQWVKELSDDSYAVRQEATAKLLSAGMPARDQLIKIVDGPDPETRASARRLVSLIDRSELQRRLEAFAADIDGKQSLSLPGWSEFQKIAGSDAAARSLFVEMQRQESPIFAAVFGVSKRVPEDVWEARLAKISQMQIMGGVRSSSPSLGTSAALLFAALAPEMTISDNAGSMVQVLLEMPALREAMQGEKLQPAARKLALHWLLECPNRSEELLTRRLSYISTTKLAEGLPLAIDVAGGNPNYLRIHALAKAQAVLIVGQLGSYEQIELLEPLLTDNSVCLQASTPIPAQPVQTVQLRDVALIALLQLTKQTPSDYGFLGAELQPTGTYNMNSLFRDGEKPRTEGLAKWRQWRTAHPASN